MSHETNWDSLENHMKDLMKPDLSNTVPGSGNGKSEEDVIGFSTIIQCKFSEKKNISILRKDIKRLKEAAELQDKTPLFASENDGELVISLLEGEHLSHVLELLVVLSQIEKLKKDINLCTNTATLNSISDTYENVTKVLTNKITRLIKSRINELLTKIEVKYQDLIQVNLFE